MDKENRSKYNGFVTQKGNYIWAGALGLAWNQLIKNHVKQPIKVDFSDNDSQKIIENFNNCKFTEQDIDKRSIYIKSGYGQETVDEINTETKKKFPQKSFGDLNLTLGQMDLIAYAYLMKNIEFNIPFKKSSGQLFQFNGMQVQSFYAQNQEQKDQVRYSYYKNKDQFMVSIKGKKSGDLIYFLKNKEIQDCDQAITAVQFYEDKMKNHLKKNDCFEMPFVDLNVQREIRQLVGKKIKNQNLEGFSFDYVFEGIKLKIDEKGAKVQNLAAITMLGAGNSENQNQPKFFIIDKDFWIVMKELGRHPYLCVLVKDPIDNE